RFRELSVPQARATLRDLVALRARAPGGPFLRSAGPARGGRPKRAAARVSARVLECSASPGLRLLRSDRAAVAAHPRRVGGTRGGGVRSVGGRGPLRFRAGAPR